MTGRGGLSIDLLILKLFTIFAKEAYYSAVNMNICDFFLVMFLMIFYPF